MLGAGLTRVGVAAKPYDAHLPDPRRAVEPAAVARGAPPPSTRTKTGRCWTFRRAAQKGLGRIWDLPLPHYQTIEEHVSRTRPGAGPTRGAGTVRRASPSGSDGGRTPSWRWRPRSRSRPRSRAASLDRLGLSTPVVIVPYGFPDRRLRCRATARQTGPFTVLAVGSHDLRKGTPYLLEAWRRAAIPDAELHLIGPHAAGQERSSTATPARSSPLAARAQERASARAMRPPICSRFRRWATGSGWSSRRRCAPGRRSSPRRAAAGRSASPTASTAGWSRRATSTRWSNGSAPRPPTATSRSPWDGPRARAPSAGPGAKPATRWSRALED